VVESKERQHLVEECVDFFNSSSEWNTVVAALQRGSDVRHLHLYLDTAIDHRDLEVIIRNYFYRKNWPLTRKIMYIPGPGYVNIYNVHPEGRAHFEVIARFDPDTVIGPTPVGATHKDAGKNFAFWDVDYMEDFYTRTGHDFRTELSEREVAEANRYFASAEWNEACEFMSRPGSLHCHAQVNTSIHPEVLRELAWKAMERRGWNVYWGVSVVYQPGADPERPKIVFLVSHPETQMEIEWFYHPHTLLQPAEQPLALTKTVESTQHYADELPFVRLSQTELRQIIGSLQP